MSIPITNNSSLIISSNTVIWEGANISCINLCTGDSISTVINALANELCDLIEDVNQTSQLNLNLGCLPNNTSQTTEGILQAIIDKLCLLVPTSSQNINLPTCLQYLDGIGNTVTTLPSNEYILLLANRICSILINITAINTAINNLQNQINSLNASITNINSTINTPATIISNCISPSQSVTISVLLSALESAFCDFRTTVGTISQINQSITSQCLLSSTPILNFSWGNNNSTYSSLTNWINNPATLAQSSQNQWVAICDLYNALNYVIENCCCDNNSPCSNINPSFTIEGLSNDNVITALKLDFFGIPNNYQDCGLTTPIKFTSNTGLIATTSQNISGLANNTLNWSIPSIWGQVQSISVEVPFCFTNGVNQCANTQTKLFNLTIPCPNVISTTTVNSITFTFSNLLGPTGIFACTLLKNNIQVQTQTITNQGSSISITFTNLIPNQAYSLNLAMSSPSFITGIICNNVATATTLSSGSSTVYTFKPCTSSASTIPADKIIYWAHPTPPILSTSTNTFYQIQDNTTNTYHIGRITSSSTASNWDYVAVNPSITYDCGSTWYVKVCNTNNYYTLQIDSNIPNKYPGGILSVYPTSNISAGTYPAWNASVNQCVELIKTVSGPGTEAFSINSTVYSNCSDCNTNQNNPAKYVIALCDSYSSGPGFTAAFLVTAGGFSGQAPTVGKVYPIKATSLGTPASPWSPLPYTGSDVQSTSISSCGSNTNCISNNSERCFKIIELVGPTHSLASTTPQFSIAPVDANVPPSGFNTCCGTNQCNDYLFDSSDAKVTCNTH
jgi:hypothetical protein